MINAGLGGAATLVFWLLGMPNPALWGALGFTLNFIPYLGALTEIAIVAVVAVASFPNFPHALLVPAAYLVLAVIEGSLVTPYVMGHRMMLNPVVVFVGVTLWGFLWNFIGVFLAVPMLVMFKIICDHIEPLAPFGEFLGSEGIRPASRRRVYRHLLRHTPT
jgi:predicted PurR-regulated permease PerM